MDSARRLFVSIAVAAFGLIGAAAHGAQGVSGKPDQQMQAVLDQLQALGGKPIESLSAEEARKQPTPADAVKALLQKQGKSIAPEPVGNVSNRSIPGLGGSIPIRIYTPKGSGPFPVVLYIHGGGWVIADLDVYDASPRALANASGAVVVSTHYRQAPEHKFPAAHDDTYAAYRWVLANAASVQGDPRRVAVAGESAGGNMAAAIAIRARDEKVQAPVHQVLIYPVATANLNTPSKKANAQAKPLNTAMLAWFGEKYLATPAEGEKPTFSILKANLRGLPPATVISAQIDPLLSETRDYAEGLKAAGVSVDYRNYDGVTHEFFGMGAVVDKAKQAVAQAGGNLKKAFAR
ncbi:MAG: alpha/beta hydrolase [Thermoanaerobaculia bacterium]|nr:alpha/beta hydrolase [Thermoanaerobaculia bacterium]